MTVYGRLAQRIYQWRNRSRPIARFAVLQCPNNPLQMIVQMERRLPNGAWGDRWEHSENASVKALPHMMGTTIQEYLVTRLNRGMSEKGDEMAALNES